jgi:hypothetical protein
MFALCPHDFLLPFRADYERTLSVCGWVEMSNLPQGPTGSPHPPELYFICMF